MPKMPKKQRKNKKREEKKKQIKAQQDMSESAQVIQDKKKWGNVYAMVFLGVAILGAAIIVINA